MQAVTSDVTGERLFISSSLEFEFLSICCREGLLAMTIITLGRAHPLLKTSWSNILSLKWEASNQHWPILLRKAVDYVIMTSVHRVTWNRCQPIKGCIVSIAWYLDCRVCIGVFRNPDKISFSFCLLWKGVVPWGIGLPYVWCRTAKLSLIAKLGLEQTWRHFPQSNRKSMVPARNFPERERERG